MEPTLVEIILLGRIEPHEREARFEEPLRDFLSSSRLGAVGGFGSTLGPPDRDGRQFVQQCSIWIELAELQRGLDPVREHLRSLGAPNGSRLEYVASGKLQKQPVW
jgi:hypothetical protein